MNKRAHRQIHRMDWQTFEEQLRPSTRGRKRAMADTEALREYFGDEEFTYLQHLAEHAQQVRSRAPILGNVVFLHGIMGSDLTVDDDGDADVVWLNLFRLARGRFEQLRLSADGSGQAHRDLKVFPSEIDKRTYSRILLWLRARWNVEPFAYDWRQDIDAASNDLAGFIRNKFPSQPVHLVTHSMGGLVSRNFIRLHSDLWHAMADADARRGGQLIMLGTPNYGSFDIPKALTGTDKLVRWLAALDLSHNLDEVIGVLNTFVGSYQMLPAPGKVPAATQTLYRRESWGAFPVSDRHLKRALEFHYALESGTAVDPSRMVYIAGCNQETLSGIRLVSPGEFDYDVTYDGDGRVTHELGLLKDVPTFYVDEVHGDLPKHEDVMKAVDELLERGTTSALPTHPMADRSLRATERPMQRGIEERAISSKLRAIAERAQREEATPEEVRDAEETILRAALTQEPWKRRSLVPTESPPEDQPQERVHITIEVVLGDVTQIKAPLVVVGHYKGIAPVRAEGAIDAKLDHWITKAAAPGMIGAELGQLFFVPVVGNKIGAGGVVLAGMGEAGRFSREDLRFLMTNVALAVSELGHRTFATVLIGSGQGNLSRERALRGMLDGLCDALSRSSENKKVRRISHVMVVETNKSAHKEIVHILEKFAQDKAVSHLSLQVTTSKLPALKRRPSKK
ncbi:MAG: M17 family peptidase N-terminal domain-containing protein, partial [Nitrospiraceae bacterium]